MADRRVRPTRVMSGWFVGVLLLLAIGVGAAYVYVVGFHYGPGDPTSGEVADALGRAMLVVALLGGMVGILVLARAQALRERVQQREEVAEPAERERAERVRAHEERVAAVAEREREQATRAEHADAAERRSGDVLMRAIEQLGSERAAVRLGALALLERLGQADPDQRQTIVDIVCGYLRLPTSSPSEVTPEKPERVVRASAQRLLMRHLVAADRRVLWRGVRLDLVGATLVDLDATGTVLSAPDFSGASFWGTTSFAGCVIDGSASLRGAKFGGTDVTFHGARFASDTLFERVTFGCPVDFGRTVWGATVGFERVLFDQAADWSGAEFADTFQLHDVDFGGATSFHAVTFGGDVALFGTTFRDSATFADATLGGHSWFEEVRAERSAPHVFPPGYREVPVDQSWVLLEHEGPAPAGMDGPPPAPTEHVADPVAGTGASGPPTPGAQGAPDAADAAGPVEAAEPLVSVDEEQPVQSG